MELSRPFIILLASLYAGVSFLATCGCAIHVGESPCLEYARAIEGRMAECAITDPDHERWLDGIYEQCDPGVIGLTFVDSDNAAACAARVRVLTCEQLAEHGAPTCVSQVKL